MADDEITRPWQAMPPRSVASIFAHYPGRWWIAGGWSLDLFVGHPSRLHEDTDVLILRPDLGHIHDLLPGWTIMAADPPGTLRPWLPGETLPQETRDVWCRPADSDVWRFQLMIVGVEGDRWIFPRDRSITFPIEDLRDRRDGIPLLAPEIQLLYKARVPHRPKDLADLQRVIPKLGHDRREWLRDHVSRLYPESPALSILDRVAGHNKSRVAESRAQDPGRVPAQHLDRLIGITRTRHRATSSHTGDSLYTIDGEFIAQCVGATMFRLDEKTALVTGGGSGIGREIALLYGKQGATVAIGDINEDAARAVATEISDAGGSAFAVHLDVTDMTSAEAAIASIVERAGGLHILVNNAGIGMVGDLVETEPDDFARLMAVNVTGVYNCSHVAVKQMLAQDPQGGAIVNIASIAGQVAVARRFAYGTTKGAVISMTQSTAMDFVDKGIRCNCICPGTVETPFVEAYLQRYHAGEVEETRKLLHARQPLGRMGRPEEIAPLALYLASDEAAYVTGAQMVIDGGLTAR